MRTQRGKSALTARGWRYDYGAGRVRVCEQRPCTGVLEIALGRGHPLHLRLYAPSLHCHHAAPLPILPYSNPNAQSPYPHSQMRRPKCAVPNAPSAARRWVTRVFREAQAESTAYVSARKSGGRSSHSVSITVKRRSFVTVVRPIQSVLRLAAHSYAAGNGRPFDLHPSLDPLKPKPPLATASIC